MYLNKAIILLIALVPVSLGANDGSKFTLSEDKLKVLAEQAADKAFNAVLQKAQLGQGQKIQEDQEEKPESMRAIGGGGNDDAFNLIFNVQDKGANMNRQGQEGLNNMGDPDSQGLVGGGKPVSPQEYLRCYCGYPLDVGKKCTPPYQKRPEIRWFFDTKTGNCQKFQFNGCGGNMNNFVREYHCYKICNPKFIGMLGAGKQGGDMGEMGGEMGGNMPDVGGIGADYEEEE